MKMIIKDTMMKVALAKAFAPVKKSVEAVAVDHAFDSADWSSDTTWSDSDGTKDEQERARMAFVCKTKQRARMLERRKQRRLKGL